MKEIDACGMSCPQPLLMLKSALNTENSLILLVDSKNAMENCTDYAEKQNYNVSLETHQEIYRLRMEKNK